MKNISILGAGKVGTSLGRALVEAGYTIAFLTCSTLAEAEESRRIIGQGEPSKNNIHAAQNGEILFITVPDDSIKDIVQELDFSDIPWLGKTVYHSSGLLASEVLQSLRTKGASTASFHPIQSFSNKYAAPSLFQNVYFGLEGEEEAVTLAKKFVHALGGHSIEISPDDKPVFHAAFSMTSNFFVVLLDSAITLLKSSGLSEEKAIQILHPLLEGTLSNIVDNRIRSALTGPIVRGDGQTVKAHLDALKKFPDIEDVYRQLANKALEMAIDEKTLPAQKIKELIQILEDR
ncbi:MAG: DUF2520 domain-containing protein [Candidatus Aminicenantes bacterium]|nr:DUF2520 domain-containing protein [Candidatus Aminicenantes bacterium]